MFLKSWGSCRCATIERRWRHAAATNWSQGRVDGRVFISLGTLDWWAAF